MSGMQHEQEPHEDPDDDTKVPALFMPNVENFFLTSKPEHVGHSTGTERLNTSFSNSLPHWTHVYSKIGIVYSPSEILYNSDF